MPQVTKGLKNIYKALMQQKKIGIIAGIGDRRDEDIKECAIAARMFDHIIIRQEKIPREEMKMK
jgi:cyanophycin synthetase